MTIADSILDRLMHKAHQLALRGEITRRQRMAMLKPMFAPYVLPMTESMSEEAMARAHATRLGPEFFIGGD